MHDCESELKANPSYDQFRCVPATFDCSCGRQYEHVCDEAEGCFYALVESP